VLFSRIMIYAALAGAATATASAHEHASRRIAFHVVRLEHPDEASPTSQRLMPHRNLDADASAWLTVRERDVARAQEPLQLCAAHLSVRVLSDQIIRAWSARQHAPRLEQIKLMKVRANLSSDTNEALVKTASVRVEELTEFAGDSISRASSYRTVPNRVRLRALTGRWPNQVNSNIAALFASTP
jgi:hypothetical protein